MIPSLLDVRHCSVMDARGQALIQCFLIRQRIGMHRHYR